nr:hypothetical protein Iba_scaffold1421CG0540 [Ipomoea batatas]
MGINPNNCYREYNSKTIKNILPGLYQMNQILGEKDQNYKRWQPYFDTFSNTRETKLVEPKTRKCNQRNC